jgi:hypothetical protein
MHWIGILREKEQEKEQQEYGYEHLRRDSKRRQNMELKKWLRIGINGSTLWIPCASHRSIKNT